MGMGGPGGMAPELMGTEAIGIGGIEPEPIGPMGMGGIVDPELFISICLIFLFETLTYQNFSHTRQVRSLVCS
jgi:hypothetical protein